MLGVAWVRTQHSLTCENYKSPINSPALQSQVSPLIIRKDTQCAKRRKRAASLYFPCCVLFFPSCCSFPFQGFTGNPRQGPLRSACTIETVMHRIILDLGMGGNPSGKRNDFQGRGGKTEGSAGEIVKGSQGAITIYFNWRALLIPGPGPSPGPGPVWIEAAGRMSL